MSKEHIKRVRLKHTGVWVWGVFRTRKSLLPYRLASSVRILVLKAKDRKQVRV